MRWECFGSFHEAPSLLQTSVRNALGDPRSARYPKLCNWVGEHFHETLSFSRLPRQHHKHLKSMSVIERLMEKCKRRTPVVLIFPNVASCFETDPHSCRRDARKLNRSDRYLNMGPLEQRKEALRRRATDRDEWRREISSPSSTHPRPKGNTGPETELQSFDAQIFFT